MLIGSIRRVQSSTVEVQGASLEDVRAQLEAQRPDGFDLVSSPVRMVKGAQLLEATGTFEQRDELAEIEADDMDALEAKVPDGWKLLSVRRA